MAKRLGFGPDALIRARPDPKQRWKLPVKAWVRELYEARFGHLIGEMPTSPPIIAPPIPPIGPLQEWDENMAGEACRMEDILPPEDDLPRDEDVPF